MVFTQMIMIRFTRLTFTHVFQIGPLELRFITVPLPPTPGPRAVESEAKLRTMSFAHGGPPAIDNNPPFEKPAQMSGKRSTYSTLEEIQNGNMQWKTLKKQQLNNKKHGLFHHLNTFMVSISLRIVQDDGVHGVLNVVCGPVGSFGSTNIGKLRARATAELLPELLRRRVPCGVLMAPLYYYNCYDDYYYHYCCYCYNYYC